MNEIIYFEINSWFSGRDFPDDPIFKVWVRDDQFGDDDWCKKNKLCVMKGPIDMSISWCVAAPKEWVLENCPDLLSDKRMTFTLCTYGFGGEKRETYTKGYADFLCHPNQEGKVYSRIGHWLFPEYCPENYGVTWNDSYWDLEDEDE